MERYLRVLQVAGRVPLHPWSMRGFSAAEWARLVPGDSAHPWAGRYALQSETARGFRLQLVRPESRVIYNSAFPFGANDGAIWAGRGITTTVQAGFVASYGPVSLQVQPLAFWAQNQEFDLLPTGQRGDLVYADPRFPTRIDLPQRFGDGAYARLDPGQSTLRIDVLGATAGVSTANQFWGPAIDQPILLGNNAPGFLHAFVGTERPVDVWVGRVHGRALWGRLEQSEYSSVTGVGARRFMAGVVGVFTPRGLDGLELGVARFYHIPWPAEGLGAEHYLKPFESFVKVGIEETDFGPDGRSSPDNQLASVFARWVLPRSGMELYGEYAKDDHNWDSRDLLLEPDHRAAYTAGLRKVWQRGGSRWLAVRGELMNSQISHLSRIRNQHNFYWHGRARQGHTHRGQILGSAFGYGGGGSTVGVDLLHADGRWTAEWSRIRVRDRWRYQLTGFAEESLTDVMHVLGVEAVLFRRAFDVTAGLRGVYELNNRFSSDAFNLNASLGMRLGF